MISRAAGRQKEVDIKAMFGYVTIDKPELRIKEYFQYKGYYCGLCRELLEKHGFAGQMTLNYDMTFLILLLTSLYESDTCMRQGRCKVHPVKKIPMLHNEITEYAADMNILLSWYKLIDTWKDDRKASALAGTHILRRNAVKVEEKYPRQAAAVKKSLRRLQAMEQKGVTDIDAVSGCFGRLMEELFVYRRDVWEQTLRSLGFFLGKFIYIMDAHEDLHEDLENHSYNPLKALCGQEGYEEKCREMLVMTIGEACLAFERLPCLKDVEILHNILYSGVWGKYNKAGKNGKGAKERTIDKPQTARKGKYRKDDQ